MKKQIRVMVVDDSLLFRNWLIEGLKADSRFEVAGYAENAFDAERKFPLLKPDVLTLDIEMPGMSGLEFLKKFLPSHPVPVILVSSLNMRVFDALAAGAVDFVRKPNSSEGLSNQAFLSTLRTKLVIASHAHVRLPAGEAKAAPGLGSGQTAAAGQSFSGSAGFGGATKSAAISKHAGAAAPSSSALSSSALKSGTLSRFSSGAGADTLIAIGASTGGTEAILSVLRQFPASMPGIVITQHMPAGFTAMYAERLNRLCHLEVREAKHGDRVRPGLVLLAPGGFQMRVVRIGGGYGVSCTKEDKVNGHCPSVDVLFDSVALHARDKAIGILLTGMGADGAAGLLRMRKNGAYTIGQDKDSCVVYGMPMEAFKIGAVCVQSSLAAIPQTVMSRLGKTRL